MKKLFITVMVVLSSALFVNAQTEFGIRGGLNMSTLEGDVENVDNYYGFHVGFFTSFKIANKLAIQPELQYSSQGMNYEFSYNSPEYKESVDGEVRLQYINLPVLFKFDVAKGFFVEAGPQVGYLAYSKQSVDYTEVDGGRTTRFSDSENLRDVTNEFDYGVTAGLGYQFKDGFFIQARYYYGLNDVVKDVDENRNSVFQFSIGFKFQ